MEEMRKYVAELATVVAGGKGRFEGCRRIIRSSPGFPFFAFLQFTVH